MSSVEQVTLPYVAPWQAEFNRYGTQILQVPKTATNTNTITVPNGQWWRVIFFSADWLTSATAGSRTYSLFFITSGSQLTITQPGTLAASSEARYSFFPGATAYVVSIPGFIGYQQTSIPDMLWGPGTAIEGFLGGGDSGDAAQGLPTIAVEIYSLKDPQQPAELRPIPLIS